MSKDITTETLASPDYQLPPRYKPEKMANWVSVAWRICWPSILIPIPLWGIALQVDCPEDALIDSLVGGFHLGSVFLLVHLFMYVLLAMPIIAFACYKPLSLIWRWWIMVPLGSVLGVLAVALLGYLLKRENLFVESPSLLLYGVGYGALTGLFATLRRPKKNEQGWA